MNDPLAELITDIAGLLHGAFVDPASPESVRCEFYHQFRKLWDRGIPVGMGLGHLLLKTIDHGLLVVRLGERGHRDEVLAAVLFTDAVTDAPRVFRFVSGRLSTE